MKRKLRGRAYARYSSESQQESSITVQLAAIRKYCAMYDIELEHEYVDEAQTGTNANRKQFQQMVKDAPLREFDIIIVHRMDRWARNVDDARYYKKYFAQYGIKVISTIEKFDETPEGEFFELLSMGMAELYSKKLSREAVAGKIANAKLAKTHGGNPLLGYQRKNKFYVIQEQEAEAVKIIFDMFIKGYGYKNIRDYLNENGYRHADGRPFTAHFSDILRNRKYIGEYIYNLRAYRPRNASYNNHAKRPESEVIRVPNGMPKIIDEETFYKAQAILDGRSKLWCRSTQRRKYLLSGLVKCSCCGRAMYGRVTYSKSVQYILYECPSRKRCSNIEINAEYLEEYLMNLFCKCLFHESNSEYLFDLTRKCYMKSYEALTEQEFNIRTKMSELAKELAQANKRLTEEMPHLLAVDETKEITALLREEEFKLKVVNEQLTIFPEYDFKKVKRMARGIVYSLQSDEFREKHKTLKTVISKIHIGAEFITTDINLQPLLGTAMPSVCRITEVRNYIAHFKEREKQTLSFPNLNISISP